VVRELAYACAGHQARTLKRRHELRRRGLGDLGSGLDVLETHFTGIFQGLRDARIIP
jgi:hypothetical protein